MCRFSLSAIGDAQRKLRINVSPVILQSLSRLAPSTPPQHSNPYSSFDSITLPLSCWLPVQQVIHPSIYSFIHRLRRALTPTLAPPPRTSVCTRTFLLSSSTNQQPNDRQSSNEEWTKVRQSVSQTETYRSGPVPPPPPHHSLERTY